eukprot:TRINITY_DN2500_c0_g1_i1.p1 TRINITY_DN2500_c0_g1~~TRINITY_DN2500_c0_g1_i1.p1  ORF type:complete len:188 (+),score=-8.19 TRINITY_DN2500_c0_g1_i1:712-1275(+)
MAQKASKIYNFLLYRDVKYQEQTVRLVSAYTTLIKHQQTIQRFQGYILRRNNFNHFIFTFSLTNASIKLYVQFFQSTTFEQKMLRFFQTFGITQQLQKHGLKNLKKLQFSTVSCYLLNISQETVRLVRALYSPGLLTLAFLNNNTRIYTYFEKSYNTLSQFSKEQYLNKVTWNISCKFQHIAIFTQF